MIQNFSTHKAQKSVTSIIFKVQETRKRRIVETDHLYQNAEPGLDHYGNQKEQIKLQCLTLSHTRVACVVCSGGGEGEKTDGVVVRMEKKRQKSKKH